MAAWPMLFIVCCCQNKKHCLSTLLCIADKTTHVEETIELGGNELGGI